MRQDKRIQLEDLRAPGTRRVMEAVQMVLGETSDEEIPTIPAGVLMKGRQEVAAGNGSEVMETLLRSNYPAEPPPSFGGGLF